MTSIRQIAREVGVHPSTVLRRMRKGLDPRLEPMREPARKIQKAPADAIAHIRRMAGDGESRAAIAEDLGASSHSLDSFAKRHGLDLDRLPRMGLRGIRTQIQGMRPAEAQEHLLYVLELLLGTPADIIDAKRQLGVSTQAAKLYVALSKACPRALSYEAMMQSISIDAVEPATKGTLAVVLVRLRRALPENETIETVWGVGYRLVRSKP